MIALNKRMCAVRPPAITRKCWEKQKVFHSLVFALLKHCTVHVLFVCHSNISECFYFLILLSNKIWSNEIEVHVSVYHHLSFKEQMKLFITTGLLCQGVTSPEKVMNMYTVNDKMEENFELKTSEELKKQIGRRV